MPSHSSLLLRLLTLTLLALFSACTAQPWDYPFPEIPPGKSPHTLETYKRPNSRLKHDAIEVNPAHKTIFANIDKEVEKAVKNHPNYGQKGFYKTTIETKKRILYWKHNIYWRSHQDLNPNVIFD